MVGNGTSDARVEQRERHSFGGGCAPARELVHEPCERQQLYGVAGCQEANGSHPPQRVTISAFGMKFRIRRQPTSRSLAFVVPRSDEGQPPTMNCGLRKTTLADVLGEEDKEQKLPLVPIAA